MKRKTALPLSSTSVRRPGCKSAVHSRCHGDERALRLLRFAVGAEALRQCFGTTLQAGDHIALRADVEHALYADYEQRHGDFVLEIEDRGGDGLDTRHLVLAIGRRVALGANVGEQRFDGLLVAQLRRDVRLLHLFGEQRGDDLLLHPRGKDTTGRRAEQVEHGAGNHIDGDRPTRPFPTHDDRPLFVPDGERGGLVYFVSQFGNHIQAEANAVQPVQRDQPEVQRKAAEVVTRGHRVLIDQSGPDQADQIAVRLGSWHVGRSGNFLQHHRALAVGHRPQDTHAYFQRLDAVVPVQFLAHRYSLNSVIQNWFYTKSKFQRKTLSYVKPARLFH